MFHGSNPYRKDNPSWAIGNAMETPKVPGSAFLLLPVPDCLSEHPVAGTGGGRAARAGGRLRDACGICVAWLIGLPRRAGARVHAMNDAEARWWHWDVTERCGGLVRQYCDARFAAMRYNPALRSDELREDIRSPDPAPPGCPCAGDL